MKKYSKALKALGLLLLVLFVAFFPKISYGLDSTLVSMDMRPIFVVPVDSYKDGGTTVYKGIKYQVIKWNMNVVMVQPDGKSVSGIERGYEIFRYPNYKDVNDGPGKELKFIKDRHYR